MGAALTPPLIVWIMITWGWREAFYISGAVGILVALLWYWLGADHPAKHPRVNAAELAYITADVKEDGNPSMSLRDVPWRKLFGRRDMWFLTGAYSVVGYIAYFISPGSICIWSMSVVSRSPAAASIRWRRF